MVDEAVGALVEGAIDALDGIGSLGESSSRRKRRRGCGWFALFGLILIAIAIAVAVGVQRS